MSYVILAGPHNLKVCLDYSEVRKCACLYISSKFALFCSNVPAEWLLSICALQIIWRMLRIVEVWILVLLSLPTRTSWMHTHIYLNPFYGPIWPYALTPGVQNLFVCPTQQFLSANLSNKARMLHIWNSNKRGEIFRLRCTIFNNPWTMCPIFIWQSVYINC